MLDVVIAVRTSVGAGVGSTVGCGDGGDVITAVGACDITHNSETIKDIQKDNDFKTSLQNTPN
jgi:uncharacterized protein YcfJ